MMWLLPKLKKPQGEYLLHNRGIQWDLYQKPANLSSEEDPMLHLGYKQEQIPDQ